jgi:uncharacterized protein
MLKITVDTNTLISAVITEGNEFALLKLANKNKVKLVLSPAILQEFKEVISRPKFNFSEEQITKVMKQIITISTLVIPTRTLHIVKVDPSNNRILECAETGKVNHIISGDKHLLQLKQYKNIPIIKTLDMLNHLKELM